MWKPTIEKEELEKYYIIEKHDKHATMNHFKLSERELYKHLHFYKIGKVLINKPSKEELENLYLNECLSHENIAKIYHKSRGCIRSWYKEYNIKIPKEITQITREKTNIKKYGTKTPLTNKECIEKGKKTSLIKYGCEKAADSKQVRKIAGERIKSARINNHTTNKELMKDQSIYKDGLTRYEYFLKKRNETLIKNGTSGKSKQEDKLYELLTSVFNDVKRQYFSNEYPWKSDFYIPELNLYIEYQGWWGHGKSNGKILGPFDENNENHLKILNEWKEKAKTRNIYIQSIKTWTILDPRKRKRAKEKNLNWLEFFTFDDMVKWINERAIKI